MNTVSQKVFLANILNLWKRKEKTEQNYLHMVTNKYVLLFIESEEMKVKTCQVFAKWSKCHGHENTWKDVTKESGLLLFVNWIFVTSKFIWKSFFGKVFFAVFGTFVWLCFPQPTTISQMKDLKICIQTCPIICHEVTEMQWNTSFSDSWYLTQSLSRP